MDQLCNNSMWGGFRELGGILMFAIWMVVIFGMMWLFRSYGHSHHRDGRHTNGESPLDIAKTRYAKGDITQEEFDHIKKTLL